MMVFLDLDGVMADFDKAFREITGSWPHEVPDNVLWSVIHSTPQFFRNLPMMPGAWFFYDWFKRNFAAEPVIITACPQENYAEIARQKTAWVRQHIGHAPMVLPVRGGPNKALFMHGPGDILIDDFEKNCMAWEIAGGKAVRHRDFETTKKELIHAIYL